MTMRPSRDVVPLLLFPLAFSSFVPLVNGGNVEAGAAWPFSGGGAMVQTASVDWGFEFNSFSYQCIGSKEIQEVFPGKPGPGGKTFQQELRRIESKASLWKVRWFFSDTHQFKTPPKTIEDRTWASYEHQSLIKVFSYISHQLKDQKRYDAWYLKNFKKPNPSSYVYRKFTDPMAIVDCDSKPKPRPGQPPAWRSLQFLPAGSNKIPANIASAVVPRPRIAQFRQPPLYSGDIRAYRPELDEKQTWPVRLVKIFGNRARPIVEAAQKVDQEYMGAPGSLVGWWMDTVVSKFKGQIFDTLTPTTGIIGPIIRRVRGYLSLPSHVRRFGRRLEEWVNEPLKFLGESFDSFSEDLGKFKKAGFNGNLENFKEASDFAVSANATMQSLLAPSAKSFLGTYKSVDLVLASEYFGTDLTFDLIEQSAAVPQVGGTVTVESLPGDRILINSPLGSFTAPRPASTVNAKQFFRAGATGSPGEHGGALGKSFGIEGAPPEDTFTSALFFIPKWRVTLANSKVNGIDAYKDIPDDLWYWYSYNSDRSGGTFGEPALIWVNFVYRENGQHLIHLFDVGKFTYGLFVLDPATSVDQRNSPLLQISGSEIVTKAGGKVIDVPVGGSVSLDGSWQEGTEDVRWRCDLLTVQKGGETLTLRNIDKQDEGLYVISGSNTEGVGMSETVAVTVTGSDRVKPTIDRFTSKPTHAGGGPYMLAGIASDNVKPWLVKYRTKAPGAKAFGNWMAARFKGRGKVQTWSTRVKLGKAGQWQIETVVLDAAKNASAPRVVKVSRNN